MQTAWFKPLISYTLMSGAEDENAQGAGVGGDAGRGLRANKMVCRRFTLTKPNLPLDRKQHVNFRPAVFNEPVPASLQNYKTEVDSSSLFLTADGSEHSEPIESRITNLDERAQLLATIHRRSSGGSGKPA
jgi:hypothetical protein